MLRDIRLTESGALAATGWSFAPGAGSKPWLLTTDVDGDLAASCTSVSDVTAPATVVALKAGYAEYPPDLVFPVTQSDALNWQPASFMTSTTCDASLPQEVSAPGAPPLVFISNTASDEKVRPPGQAYFYLVTGRNELGPGPIGQASTGARRFPNSPCS